MFSSDFRAIIKNTSPFVKFVCIAITIGYVLSFLDDSLRILSVTPGLLSPPNFWIWTLFTFWTIEVHFLSFLADVLTVLFCGKLIEPLWGSLEMWKFFAIVNTFVAILSSVYCVVYAMITQASEHLYDVHIHGLAGYIAAVAVAVRQILPDHLILKAPFGRFTTRNVPLTGLIVTIVLWAVKLMDGQTPVMFTSGTVVSWIYLRFYQRHHGSRGDGAENFTFASFFPVILQPAISCLTGPIYNLSLRIGLIKKFSPPRAADTHLTSVNVTFPHDIERRRQIAIKALYERFNKANNDSSRQSLIPKSLPSTSKQHHGGQHQHQHHHPHNHPLLQPNASFIPPAIPLPPPPSTSSGPSAIDLQASTSMNSSTSSAVLIDAQLIDMDDSQK